MMIPYSNDDAFVIAGQVYDDFYRCGDLKATTSISDGTMGDKGGAGGWHARNRIRDRVHAIRR